MKEIVVTLPDSWPKNKPFHSPTLMNCEKCEFHTPDSATFIKHLQDHIFNEPMPDILVTAP